MTTILVLIGPIDMIKIEMWKFIDNDDGIKSDDNNTRDPSGQVK